MGYVFTQDDAESLSAWFSDPENRRVADLETALLERLHDFRPGTRLLDVGCGTGWFLKHFRDKGLSVTGVDPSNEMLSAASDLLGPGAELERAFGEELPFEDNSFDAVTLITSLEFSDDPQKVIAEAARVARGHIIIGFLNRYAVKNIQRRIRSFLSPTVYSRARFFSVWEVKRLATEVLGEVPMQWGSVWQLPLALSSRTLVFERMAPVQALPFGAFAAVVVECRPRYRLRPLFLDLGEKKSEKLAGSEVYYKGVPGKSATGGLSSGIASQATGI